MLSHSFFSKRLPLRPSTVVFAFASFAALTATAPLNAQSAPSPAPVSPSKDGKEWVIGAPIVTYWAGPGYPGAPPLNDAAATQIVEGGYNLAWCQEAELDTVKKHGLRGLLTNRLLDPSALKNPESKAELDALIERVRQHPGLYAYHLIDEPSAKSFGDLKQLIDYIREKDTAHLFYINLLPTYASNEQLGTQGNTEDAYNAHVQQYVDIVKPRLISYDHYQFTNTNDNSYYFLNLALIRKHALAANVPFLNIVQAASWEPTNLASPTGPRIPTGDEVRYLVYTTLAYGAQGISYYVYGYPGHTGGMASLDGTPTPLYHAVKPLNHEFLAIASELQSLKSLGVYHAGNIVPGSVPLPADAAFTFDPVVTAPPYELGQRVKGALMGTFGAVSGDNASPSNSSSSPSHVVVVNLDYKTPGVFGVTGPGPLDVFDASSGKWNPAEGSHVKLDLPGGGGALVRLRPGAKP